MPGLSIWVGNPLARSLDTKCSNGWLILEARLFSHVLRVWDLTIGPDGAFGIMDINWLEASKPNVVMEKNLMEGSFWRPGFFSHVLRVWDMTNFSEVLGLAN